MLSIDIESTGIDWSHGTRPFFVSIQFDDGVLRYYEWDVDPLTRQPKIPTQDVKKIQEVIDVAAGWARDFDEETALRHCIVGQNFKFDITGLETIGIKYTAFENTYDTILASHLLDSSQFHNLTDLAARYLQEDIRPFEDAIDAATKEARKMVQQARLQRQRFERAGETIRASQVPLADWAIASEGRADMPSASGKRVWKADMWLPRAAAKFFWEQEDDPKFRPPAKGCQCEFEGHGLQHDVCRRCGGHHWWTVLREYANPDTAVTLALTGPMWEEIRRRKLWAIYREKCRQIYPFYRMERAGVGYIHAHADEIVADYTGRAEDCHAVCTTIAAGKGWELELGRGGNVNDSLKQFLLGRYADGPDGKPDKLRFVRDERCLNLPILGITDSGGASLDKKVMEEYEETLPTNGKEGLFIKKLAWMRRFGVSITFKESYDSLAVPAGRPGYSILHPNFNMTGTKHLRSSSNNPNGQNISKQETKCGVCDAKPDRVKACRSCGGKGVTFKSMRYCFGPAPGREWWSMDFSNIERRIPAFVAGETEIIDLLERPDEAPYYGSEHLLICHTLHKRMFEECCWDAKSKKLDGRLFKDKYKSTWYQWTKNAVFAMLYGCGEAKADGTAHCPGAYRMVKQRFHRSEDLNQRQIEYANKYGHIVTLPDRTVDPDRGYPIQVERGQYGKVVPTQPLNYFSSGTACWVARLAMTRCQRQLDEWEGRDGFDGRMILFVHDELVFDFPRGGHPVEDRANSNLERALVLRELMQQGGRNLVPALPLPVNVEWHPVSWDKGVAIR